MAGWVGLVGWLIADALPTKWAPSSLAQDRESSPTSTNVLTTMLHHHVYGSRDEAEPEMIADESVEKPEGWLVDEPELVPDPSSGRPEDWYVSTNDAWQHWS